MNEHSSPALRPGSWQRRMDPASSLRPSECVDSGAAGIRELAAKLAAAHRHPRDQARCFFEYVRDEIPYNFAPEVRDRRDFRASHTLEVGSGFCMQKAALFAALCRASGIPARLGFQDITDYKIVDKFLELMGTNRIDHHGMNGVYLDGRWIRVDCTLDRALSERKKYHLVEFDGRHDAVLPATDLLGRPHFTIRKQAGFYNTTPWFAMREMLDWVRNMPYDQWRSLVHRKGGSM